MCTKKLLQSARTITKCGGYYKARQDFVKNIPGKVLRLTQINTNAT